MVVGLGRPGGADEPVLSPGHGLTPAGELTLRRTHFLGALADIRWPSNCPHASPRRDCRSRRCATAPVCSCPRWPVEFTANPIGAIQRDHRPRTVEDGDVIEATAVVLVPWTDDDATDALMRGAGAQRGRSSSRTGQAAGNVAVGHGRAAEQCRGVAGRPMVRRELGTDRADRPARHQRVGAGPSAAASRISTTSCATTTAAAFRPRRGSALPRPGRCPWP